ncbi:MAG: hypothetical protein ABI134_03185 [Byssovorax sp.]
MATPLSPAAPALALHSNASVATARALPSVRLQARLEREKMAMIVVSIPLDA